jgi:hypothetical protein
MALWEREKLFFFEAVTAAVACKGLRTKNSSRQRQRQEGERERRGKRLTDSQARE